MAKQKIVIWTGSTYKTRSWPPGEPFKPDRDATKWRNSTSTRSDSLFNALCFFLTTGWPTEALDDFLRDIKPKAGWVEEWEGREPECSKNDLRRTIIQNGPAVSRLFLGHWEPAQPPRGKK